MNEVTATKVTSYECNCPHCNQKIYSEYCDDWDLEADGGDTIEIICFECGNDFEVYLPY